ncbi:HlyD family type I secretion periplasmic adaptor subunit [Desulfogranum mediterraneum]|uniref:HlyD family type I secretion periplasmic adaptor subunit n=1 Tax=Desulfogranum mediterraneum TaxID=160661 RepID=UPI0004105A0B|nr:HlyD family type I secretion periplasmic adaptor subunit [Desulfogranum mediterraneum]
MKKKNNPLRQEILEYQPDAVEIEERPVPGRIRWVLYLILCSLVMVVIGAIIFKVDRIVVTEGELITTAPTIVVQPMSTAVVRTIHVEVGEVVEQGQVLATLDPTFTGADLSQLTREKLALGVQIRRIKAELGNAAFAPTREEGEDGELQQQLLQQRRRIFARNQQTSEDRIAALEAKLALNVVRCQGLGRQLKLLRDVEGTTARLPQNNGEYRLRLLEAQKARTLAKNEEEGLQAEAKVIRNEIRQVRSEWQRFVEERQGELMEQQVTLHTELEKVLEGIKKAERLHELVSLRAPEQGIVLKMAKRSVGSIVQQAESFVTLVPTDCSIEVEAEVQTKDIGRIRKNDTARVKLDAFPFQRHGTLPGRVRVISEDAWHQEGLGAALEATREPAAGKAYYKARIELLSTRLRDVPAGFRIMPGMKVRAEIKVGRRSVISYFLYPIIRALDESLREP